MADKVKNAFTEASTLSGAVSGLADSLLQSAVGGLSPLNNFGRYMTGARAIIKVNDKLFGFAFAVSFNISTEYVENNVIDSYVAYELMPTRISVNGTLSMLHVPDKGPTKELVQANVLSYLMHRYITLEISDQTTGQTIFKTNKAVITTRRQTLQAGELSTIELTWKALGWIDELAQPFYPQGADGKDAESGPASGLAAVGKALGF
jgi:hypothetical protein